jgi:hypothetical protein
VRDDKKNAENSGQNDEENRENQLMGKKYCNVRRERERGCVCEKESVKRAKKNVSIRWLRKAEGCMVQWISSLLVTPQGWTAVSAFFKIPCCLSLTNFRLEDSIYWDILDQWSLSGRVLIG